MTRAIGTAGASPIALAVALRTRLALSLTLAVGLPLSLALALALAITLALAFALAWARSAHGSFRTDACLGQSERGLSQRQRLGGGAGVLLRRRILSRGGFGAGLSAGALGGLQGGLSASRHLAQRAGGDGADGVVGVLQRFGSSLHGRSRRRLLRGQQRLGGVSDLGLLFCKFGE